VSDRQPIDRRPWPFYRPAVLWGFAAGIVALTLGLASGRAVLISILFSIGAALITTLWWFRILTLDERAHKPRKIDLP
jgi:hypothetical protein